MPGYILIVNERGLVLIALEGQTDMIPVKMSRIDVLIPKVILKCPYNKEPSLVAFWNKRLHRKPGRVS